MRRTQDTGISRRAVWCGRTLLLRARNVRVHTAWFVAMFGFIGGALLRPYGDPGSGGRLIVVAIGVVAGGAVGFALALEAVRAALNQRWAVHLFNGFRELKRDGLTLRPAVQADAEDLHTSYDQVTIASNGLADTTPNDARLALSCGLTVGQILAAMNEEQTVVGFAVFNGFQDDGNPEVGLWLLPQARGQGYGATIVRMLAELVRIIGHQHAWLGMRATNTAMAKSCLRAGAVHVEDKPHTLPNGETVTSTWFRV